MKAKPLKEVSGNTLSELQTLMYRIAENMGDFCHVTDHVPNSLKKQLAEFTEKLAAETERRYEDLKNEMEYKLGL